MPHGYPRLLHTQRMGTTTARRVALERPAATIYWRRRFVTLVLGLSVLALIAWAFSASLGGTAPTTSGAATRTVHGSLPSQAAPSPGLAAKQGGATGQGRAPAKHSRAIAVGGLLPCPAGSVVLSLFSSQASYPIRQTPEFEVDVVSTASQSCTFDIGAAHVLLQILSGPLRIWTSADCAEGTASLVTQLHRGMPTVVPITWNGQRSSPGCPVPGTAAPRGSYTAMASDGSERSNAVVFRIGQAG